LVCTRQGSNLQPYYDVTKRSPNVTFGGTVTLGMLENMIGLVDPEYLWMGSLENQTVALGAARGCVSTLLNTNVTGQVVFGRFSDFVIVNWAELDLVTDPFSLGDYG
jgi:hypothetical protein